MNGLSPLEEAFLLVMGNAARNWKRSPEREPITDVQAFFENAFMQCGIDYWRFYSAMCEDTPRRIHVVKTKRKPRYIPRPNTTRIACADRRARKLGRPSSFAFSDWQACLDHFHHCCAYCGSPQGLWNPIGLDHLIPLSNPQTPGNVVTNIVPACRLCNSSKNDSEAGDWLRAKVGSARAGKILARIKTYFAEMVTA